MQAPRRLASLLAVAVMSLSGCGAPTSESLGEMPALSAAQPTLSPPDDGPTATPAKPEAARKSRSPQPSSQRRGPSQSVRTWVEANDAVLSLPRASGARNRSLAALQALQTPRCAKCSLLRDRSGLGDSRVTFVSAVTTKASSKSVRMKLRVQVRGVRASAAPRGKRVVLPARYVVDLRRTGVQKGSPQGAARSAKGKLGPVWKVTGLAPR